MTTEREQLYWVWCDMRFRCTAPRHKGYENYGGRGITFCERWKMFANFLADMGPRPSGSMLERNDNDGNYEPANCRWATRKEQNSNRRCCIYLDDGVERVTLKEYCRRHNLKYRPIVKRIQYRGWTMERALREPIRPPSGRPFA